MASAQRLTRIEVWKQKRISRRGKSNQRLRYMGWYGDWPHVLSYVEGRQAMRVHTFYDRSYRERLVQVFIGTRKFLRENR